MSETQILIGLASVGGVSAAFVITCALYIIVQAVASRARLRRSRGRVPWHSVHEVRR